MITKTFTATGTSAETPISCADLSISGTFVATITLQRYFGGAWVDVESYTAPTQVVVDPGNSQSFRLNCSAHTSGSAVCALG